MWCNYPSMVKLFRMNHGKCVNIVCGKPNNQPSPSHHHLYGWYVYHPQTLGLWHCVYHTLPVIHHNSGPLAPNFGVMASQ